MTNTVELIGYYGNDTVHAQSAWTSTSRELSEDKIDRIPTMLKTLADNGHETPFEKSMLHFLVTCEQASHIHLLKHRIGVSINGESARYKELKEDKFYIPEDFELDTDTPWADILEQHTKRSNELYHQCLTDLTARLGRKRAKESARFFKTMNSQITLDVSFNFRSFVHFQRLRNSQHAQIEIQEIAQCMLNRVKAIEGNPFEHTIKAFDL
jgi:flavin-dependent thymidylate synthase